MSMDFGKLNFAVAFNPQTAFPIDARCYFESLTAAETAAAKAEAAGSSNTVYYFGQNVAVVENNIATLYIITPKTTSAEVGGVLKEVGSATLGDGSTIDLVDKQLGLHDFGKFYYAYVEDDTQAAGYKYVKTAITEDNKSKLAGLEPKIVANAAGTGYELAWYEPNKTTIEGVSSKLSTLETSVANNTSAIQTLNGTGDGSVKKQIADAVGKIHSFDFVKVNDKEAPAEGDVGESNKIYLYKHGDHYDEYMYFPGEGDAAGSWERLADIGDVNLDNYYTKSDVDGAIDADVLVETNRAKGIEDGLATRIDTLEAAKSEANKVNDVLVKTGDADAATVVTNKVATIDLTPYATKAALNTVDEKITDTSTGLLKRMTDAETAINTINSTSDGILAKANEYTDGKFNTLSTDIDGVKETIGTVAEGTTVMAEIGKKVASTDFETFKTDNTTAISTAKNDAITAAGTATDTKISTAVGDLGESKSVKEYVDAKVSAATPSDYATVKEDVAANKEAIAAINNASTGILAQAKTDATNKANAVLGTTDDTATDKTVYGAFAAAAAAQASANAKVSSITGDKSISATKGDGTTEYTLAVKVSSAEGNLLTVDDDGLKVLHKDAPEYTVVKSETAETGYAATYRLTKAGTAIGASINIPKDYLVKSASLKVSSAANVPEEGYAAGDKYIEFVINTSESDGNEKKIYLNVKDLVDVYTAGIGVEISATNVVSAKVVTGNGLSVDADGIKLATAGKDAEGDGYHAGAMTAVQAEKLAGVESGAQVNVIDGVADADGNTLTITSKKVQLPRATATKLGLVKSSTGANAVQVADDGTMSVGSLNASTLVSDKWILISGGDASAPDEGTVVTQA